MYLYYYDIVYPPPTPQAWRDMLPPLDALAKTLKVLSPMYLSCYRGGCLLYPVRSCFGETEGSGSEFKVCIVDFPKCVQVVLVAFLLLNMPLTSQAVSLTSLILAIFFPSEIWTPLRSDTL